MGYFRTLSRFLRRGFPSRRKFVAVLALLVILDSAAFLGLVWFFFLKTLLPVAPQPLLWISVVYLLLVLLLAVLSLGGQLNSLKAVVLFYLSVGLFFMLRGLLEIQGRVFSVWPWILVWVATLALTVQRFGLEWSEEEKEPPRE